MFVVCIFLCSISYELKKEARACFLQHVNIVVLLAIIFELGHYGIVMEYVLHGALNDFIFIYDVCCLVSCLFKLCAHILKISSNCCTDEKTESSSSQVPTKTVMLYIFLCAQRDYIIINYY